MALITPNEGEIELLRKMLHDPLTVDENYILKLFRNDFTPGDSSTSVSFTEANFTNYVAKTLTRALWNIPVTVTNKAQSSLDPVPIGRIPRRPAGPRQWA
jgi:hypothetical protein